MRIQNDRAGFVGAGSHSEALGGGKFEGEASGSQVGIPREEALVGGASGEVEDAESASATMADSRRSGSVVAAITAS